MKTILLTPIIIFMSVSLIAQTSVTYKNNSLLTGDSFNFREIKFTDPGNAGANQIWDYSKIQYTGKSPVNSIQNAIVQNITSVGDYNLLLNENGYDYFMSSSENKLEELGYENKDLKINLTYSDPVVKMKYPLLYGEQFSDHFIGVATYDKNNIIDFFGDYSVTADAYGTLVLPDRIIENTLRVKSIKKGLQINKCGTVDINIVRYMWYASGYRYPVMSINIVENTYSGRAPEITKTALINTTQHAEPIAPADKPNSVKQIKNQDILVTLSPNPFTDKLTYSYFLTGQTAVSIELHDISGQIKGWLVTNQNQSEGLHYRHT